MESMEQLIGLATRKLENTTKSSDMVGNRPHFPIYCVMDSSNWGSAYQIIYRQMERIWPQAAAQVLFASYSGGPDGSFTDPSTGKTLGQDDIRLALDRLKMTRNVVSEMRQLRLYHILDTSVCESLEDFQEHYRMILRLRETVADSYLSMLIVLLDDSSIHRETANAIKAFLADSNGDYDGTFIIATRTRDNSLYEIEALFRIVADILILSNNDAVSEVGDPDASARTSGFYNGHVNTVSYLLLERPNRQIALQLIKRFLDSAETAVEEEDIDRDTQKLRSALGIVDNKLPVCEDFLKNSGVCFGSDALEYLPRRNCSGSPTLAMLTYEELHSASFSGILSQFIDFNYRTDALPAVEINRCADRFRETVCHNLSAKDALALTNETVDRIFSQLNCGEVDRKADAAGCLRDTLNRFLRENILYPRCKAVLKDIYEDAAATLQELERVRSDIKRYIPIEGFENLGKMYETIADMYLRSESGENDRKALLRPGNKYDDILNQLLEMVGGAVKYDRQKFSLSFINEWAERLKLAGDAVYRKIRTSLDENSNDRIHLFGNFPIEEKLQIYLFHTYDTEENRKTNLCDYLSRTYEGIAGVQFFNTGFDDALEAIKVIDCGGDKLKL